MFVYPEKNSAFVIFILLELALLSITLVQCFKSSSNMNLSNVLNVYDHINIKSISIPENKSHINYSTMEPVLFEKVHDIKLTHSVFRATTFFQFDSTKVALSLLLQYAHDFNENLKQLYSKLLLKNILIVDHITKDNASCLTQLYLTQF